MKIDDLPTLFAAAAGALLSYLADKSPWYNSLSKKDKGLVMALALILVGAATYGVTCTGILLYLFPAFPLLCDQSGAQTVVSAILAALLTNQGSYLLFFSASKSGATPALPEAVAPPIPVERQ